MFSPASSLAAVLVPSLPVRRLFFLCLGFVLGGGLVYLASLGSL